MLKEIKITNLAIIEKLQISFSDGLVVLTGETGAGKSVILQAIYLLSGGSATSSWIRTGSDTSAVEAFFECPPDSDLFSEIQNMGVETDGTIAIKRILSRKGKSRFYINGSFASAKMAGEITENLLSVASQHDHQQLVKPAMHLDFIDSVGDLRQERGELSSLYDQWKALTKEFSDLKQQEMDKEQRRDFLLFQRNEITDAGICAGEDEELLLAKDRLRASEDLMRLGKEGYDLLAGNVLDDLARLRKNLEQMAGFDTSLAGFAEEVAGYSFQLEDSATRLRRYLEIIPDDPSQLETITARLHLLQQLKRKYG
ncbi:MAG: AAA family ATPase, partial [Desulfobulbaceae bacterium]|nr:AAA family ATPase [Desulfobulbaceae bacterium]